MDSYATPSPGNAGTSAPPVATTERKGPRAGRSAILPMAAWFGLAAGLIEVAARSIRGAVDSRVSEDLLRVNRHWLWMAPAADLALFSALGLALVPLARLRPGLVLAAGPYLLGFLASLAGLLTIPGLHLAAVVLLAIGIAFRVGSMANARRLGFDRLIRRSLPVMSLVLIAAIIGGLIRVEGSESRALGALPRARAGLPNVLFIVLDDVRADRLSPYGYGRLTTPFLDELSRRGARFDEARATAPWTLPSHASMFTGRWPRELSTRVDRPLDSAEPTLAEYLCAHGYATAGFVGNTYYGNTRYGLDRGFARYRDHPENEAISPLEILRASTLGHRLADKLRLPGAAGKRRSAAMINRDALAWLDGHPGGDRPYFLFLNYYDAHAPFDPPAGAPRRWLDPESRPDWAKDLSSFRRLGRHAGNRSDEESRQATALIRRAASIMSDSYDDCLAYLDGELRKLFDGLERRGLLENTLVVITSDHGEHFGEHELFGHGVSLYRAEVRVPLIILSPDGASPGATIADPVSLRDLPATIVDRAGLTAGSPFPGLSLARHWVPGAVGGGPGGLLLSEVEHQRKFPPAPHIPASRGPVESLVAAGRVYIRNADGREELYDLASDPAETRNLATRPEEDLLLQWFRDLRQRLDDDESPPQPRDRAEEIATR